jgi:translation initiation factor 2 subunit 2
MTDYDELLDKAQDEVPDESDEGERFEIPEVDTRKDGSKTIVENFSEIVDRFGRDEKHVSKFIQNELGTAGHIESGELVLNGEFRRGNINGRIDNYADQYVFCPECGRPDTQVVKEKGVEMLKCEACGSRTPL